MPRRKRRGHALRGLTFGLRAILENGYNLIDSDDFENEAEERAAWVRYRDTIMSEWNKPGQRPAAWWKYEAGVDVPVRRPGDSFADEWFQQMDLLFERGMLTDEEQERCEVHHRELSPSPEGHATVEALRLSLKQGPWPGHMLRVRAGRCEFASRWHARRGRPERAEHYEELAGIYCEHLKGE